MFIFLLHLTTGGVELITSRTGIASVDLRCLFRDPGPTISICWKTLFSVDSNLTSLINVYCTSSGYSGYPHRLGFQGATCHDDSSLGLGSATNTWAFRQNSLRIHKDVGFHSELTNFILVSSRDMARRQPDATAPHKVSQIRCLDIPPEMFWSMGGY